MNPADAKSVKEFTKWYKREDELRTIDCLIQNTGFGPYTQFPKD